MWMDIDVLRRYREEKRQAPILVQMHAHYMHSAMIAYILPYTHHITSNVSIIDWNFNGNPLFCHRGVSRDLFLVNIMIIVQLLWQSAI